MTMPHIAASTLASRRAVLAALASSAILAGDALAANAAPRAGTKTFRVAVATNEPWGTYHVTPVLDDVLARGGTVTQIVPDLSGIKPGETVPVLPLSAARAQDFDLLVVNGATEWPATVVTSLVGVPVVASSLAYLRAELAPFADVVRPRLVGVTASSEAERETFAAHLGVKEQHIRIVGIPELDTLPEWNPQPRTVLVLTSVTKSSTTGGSAPGTQLLLDSAHALKAAGWHVLVGLHPREDRSLWSGFEVATEGSLAASARAEVAIGIPGSVFPKIAAVGVPLVAALDPALNVPQYLLDIATPAWTVNEVVTAVENAQPLDKKELREVVGPLGKAGRTLTQFWFASSRRG